MKLFKTLSRSVYGILFILGGINHFWKTDVYTSIMPLYLPYHRELVIISGIAEIGLGALLCIPIWSRLAAWGLIALLIAVFPANIQMALHPEQYHWVSPIVLYLRLPLQVVLIGWAYWYTLPNKSVRSGLPAAGAARNKL